MCSGWNPHLPSTICICSSICIDLRLLHGLNISISLDSNRDFMISDLLFKNGESSYFMVMCWHIFPMWIIFSVCLHQSIRRAKSLPWQRDLLEESLRAVGLPGIENGAKLFVSNLDGGVSNEDIRVQPEPYIFILYGSLLWISHEIKWTCFSGTFLWNWRPKAICNSLWQKWPAKCKYQGSDVFFLY